MDRSRHIRKHKKTKYPLTPKGILSFRSFAPVGQKITTRTFSTVQLVLESNAELGKFMATKVQIVCWPSANYKVVPRGYFGMGRVRTAIRDRCLISIHVNHVNLVARQFFSHSFPTKIKHWSLTSVLAKIPCRHHLVNGREANKQAVL